MSKAYTLKITRSNPEESRVNNREYIKRIQKAKKFIQEVKKLDTSFNGNIRRGVTHLVEIGQSTISQSRHTLKYSESVQVTVKHRSIPWTSFSQSTTIDGIHAAVRDQYARAKQELRVIRQDRKLTENRPAVRYLGGGARYTVNRVGNMIAPGEIARLVAERKSKIVFTAKYPRTQERHVGIELEFISSADRVKLGAMLALAELGEYVHLKGDGSIRVDKSGYHAHELSACIPESQRKVVISKIAGVLKEAGALINKSCGFHVHLDMRNRDRQKSFSNLVSAQNVFYAMNPKSRKESTYCKKTLSKDLDKERNGSRYKGVNAAALSKYGTLEIRIHSGTVDDAKINNWVDLLISVTDADAPFKRAPRTIDSFCKGYKIPSELRSYIIERIRKFNGGVDVSEVSEVG